MTETFRKFGKADFLLGGQWGSEGKGAAAAALACIMDAAGGRAPYDIVTTNAGAQAGHTSTHNGVKRVVFHLPTYPLIVRDLGYPRPVIYLNAGSIIDPAVLLQELKDNDIADGFFIHPNAAIITDDCRAVEGAADSMQTRIASTRKGVGQALSRKVLRSGLIAKDCPELTPFLREGNLNLSLTTGQSVLVEVPQGLSLSVNGKFYPYCTSRDCTVEQALSDGAIHPSFYGSSMLVLRTFPIRVGNIMENGQELGQSGDYYPDQQETSWEEIGRPAEITTVTKRVRRVFTFSFMQMAYALVRTRPSIVYLTFCDYLDRTKLDVIVNSIKEYADAIGLPQPQIIYQYGPSTDDFCFEPK